MAKKPLAALLRPTTLADIVGQSHLIGPGMPIRLMAEKQHLQSSVLWGPPGIGKTTIVRALAYNTGAMFHQLNATESGIKVLRDVIAQSEKSPVPSIVFVDECLPYNTLITCLIGDEIVEIPIGRIVDEKLQYPVLSFNHDTSKLEWSDIVSWSVVEQKPMIEIEIDDRILRCSHDHLIYTTNRGYVKAGDLTIDDDLYTFVISQQVMLTKIKSIRKIKQTEILYDIGVANNHNFFAEKVLVHNCHRWNTTQQDALLPSVEDGSIIFFGATTEKPKFAVRSTILSRCLVFEVKPLDAADLCSLILKVREHYKANGKRFKIDQDAVKLLINRCSGDARKLLTALEAIVETLLEGDQITVGHVEVAIPDKHLVFDAAGNEHYDLAHCYQEAIQHSDVDSALYWLAKWLESGEDPAYISRRMLITAFEDCAGNPIAPLLAAAAAFAVERTGLPEARIPMALATCEMAKSKRNKTAYYAIDQAINDVRSRATVHVPPEMRAGTDGYLSAVNRIYVKDWQRDRDIVV